MCREKWTNQTTDEVNELDVRVWRACWV